MLLQPFDGLFEAVPVEGEMVVQEAGLAEPTVEPGAETHCDEKIFLRRARSVCLGLLPLVYVDDASYALRPGRERGQVDSTAVHACQQAVQEIVAPRDASGHGGKLPHQAHYGIGQLLRGRRHIHNHGSNARARARARVCWGLNRASMAPSTG